MKTALIIDDSKAEAELMTAVLKDNGFVCEHAEDGEKGEARALELKPDIILLDVVMPGKPGFQVCRSLKKNAETSSIPVILVTSKGEETDQLWGRKQGAVDYVVKPFEPEELLATVQKHVG